MEVWVDALESARDAVRDAVFVMADEEPMRPGLLRLMSAIDAALSKVYEEMEA